MRMCKEGLIEAFLKYAENQESPRLYKFWAMIGGIASLLGRRAYINRGYFKLYPNLYILLVSKSGVGRKSSAAQLVINLLDKTKLPLNVLRGKITPAKLITRLYSAVLNNPSGDAELLIFSREFKVFTKGITTDSSLIEDLTDLYDGGVFEYDTKGQGSFQIKKPCINIIAASTPEWLTTGGRGNSADVLTGGFGARVVPVSVLVNERKVAWPEVEEVNKELEAKIVHDCIQIYNMKGEFKVTPEAKEAYEKWYLRSDEEVQQDLRLQGYFAKKHDLVLKVAMSLSVAESEEMVIEAHHVKGALAALKEIEFSMTNAYAGVATSDKSRNIDLLLNGIREKGEVSHTELLNKYRYYMNARELSEALGTLLEGELIRKRVVATATKSKVVYTLNLIKESELEELAEC